MQKKMYEKELGKELRFLSMPLIKSYHFQNENCGKKRDRKHIFAKVDMQE